MATPITPTTPANANLALGNSFVKGVICDKSKKQYSGKVAHFNSWVKKEHPLLFDTHNQCVNLRGLDGEVLTEFFGHISKKRKLKEEREGEPYKYIEPTKYQSYQHVSGYKSAIKFEFKNRRVPVPEETDLILSDLFGGYKRKVAELKQNGELPVGEGKQPITFEGVRFLAKEAMKQTHDYPLAIFAHIFVLLCWNLVARSVSVSSLMYNHMCWDGDAMVIVFPSHKGDKEGNVSLPKHVFANPLDPELCPILWLAVYVFTTGFRRTEAKPLVFGAADGTESRFSKWLKSICGVHAAALLAMGLLILEIGTHSFRKGVATFLSSMCGGPGPISIYLRAGWSLGPVQSRYILDGGGGDQLCGRAATSNLLVSILPR
eukprot:gene16315-18618_t